MRFEQIQRRLSAIPEVAAWADLGDLVSRAAARRSTPVWEYPLHACRAVGGGEEAALPAAAAIYCSLLSIHLVDDLLDEDPRGAYRRLGAGAAANLALALQAAGHRLLDEAPATAETRAVAQGNLARMALATAYGQSLDSEEAADEEGYWRVVAAKTPPLFGSSLFLGAVLGGAPLSIAGGLEEVGGLVGRLVQVSDDLADAMQQPAGADWRRPGNNLALLYALTSEHAEREALRACLPEVGDAGRLEEAQRILLRCGAVSYCAYRLLGLADQARARLEQVRLPDPSPLLGLLDEHLRPLAHLLRQAGVESPESVLAG